MTPTATTAALPAGGTTVLVAAVVTLAGDRLHAGLGYHEHFPDGRRRTRFRLAGFGLVWGLATTVAVRAGLWLPLVLVGAVTTLAVRRELTPRPEFVPIQDLEPAAGPAADATVVENGLVVSDLLSGRHVWLALASLAGVVEVGIRTTFGWPLPPVAEALFTRPTALLASVLLAGTYPVALILRRPWRETSTGEGGWYVTAGFYAAAWGGAWLVLGVATFLLLRHVIVSPFAALVAVLVLVHLPPDEGDAPMELFLLYWPLGLVGTGLLAGVEWLLRS